jgi:hypothetical protein
MEFFFNNVWQVAIYLFFGGQHTVFKFMLINLNLLYFSIIDYFLWSVSLFKSNKLLLLNKSLFAECVFDFLYYSRIKSSFDVFRVFAKTLFQKGVFDFNLYFAILSIRDFFFKIVDLSSMLSVYYFFISNFLYYKKTSKLINVNFIDLKKNKSKERAYFFFWLLEKSKRFDIKG